LITEQSTLATIQRIYNHATAVEDYESAIECLQYGLKYFPEDFNLKIQLGLVYITMEDLDIALPYLLDLDANTLDPKNKLDIYYVLGIAYQDLDDVKALHYFSLVIDNYVVEEITPVVLALSERAQIYFGLGEKCLAEQDLLLALSIYNRCEKLNPQDFFDPTGIKKELINLLTQIY
jgi:tetratricopeptide (TPR) repeat protein